MQFIKKNYEKVLLALVLVGMVGAVGFMIYLVSKEKQQLEDRKASFIRRRVVPLEELPTDRYDVALKQVSTPITLDFSSNNRLFSPVRVLKGLDGRLIFIRAGSELEKLEITRMTNLFLIVSLDNINATDSGVRYGISIERQAAAKAGDRGRRTYYLAQGEKKDVIRLLDVKGPPDSPTELILDLADADKPISIAKDKPYRRVEGYLADLRYAPENKNFPNRRANDPVSGRIFVAGEQYNIVAINENEVVLSAPNGRKYTVRYNSTP
jgi:hypothetical protein